MIIDVPSPPPLHPLFFSLHSLHAANTCIFKHVALLANQNPQFILTFELMASGSKQAGSATTDTATTTTNNNDNDNDANQDSVAATNDTSGPGNDSKVSSGITSPIGASRAATAATPAQSKKEKDVALIVGREKLKMQLRALEKQIYAMEGAYLQETHAHGNVVKGFDSYMSRSGSGSMRNSTRGRFRDEDRIMSLSSSTSPATDALSTAGVLREQDRQQLSGFGSAFDSVGLDGGFGGMADGDLLFGSDLGGPDLSTIGAGIGSFGGVGSTGGPEPRRRKSGYKRKSLGTRGGVNKRG